MPDFTITKARNAGEKDNPHGGKLVRWYIGLQGAPSGEEDVYVQKKPGNDLSPGMEISGRLERGEYGWRLFPEPQQGNFQRPAYKREGYVDAPPDPQAERSRRIERQHSQEMAIRVLAANDALKPAHPTTTSIRAVIREWTDYFAQDLDADVGSSQVAHGASAQNHPPVDGDAADLSAEEASPQLKGALTQEFHKAGFSRDAMKAVVMFRCGGEKATKGGAAQLVSDLREGATHDALLAEIWDAKRAGNPLGARAAALIPTEVPMDTEGLPEDDGSLPEVPAKDEEGIPF